MYNQPTPPSGSVVDPRGPAQFAPPPPGKVPTNSGAPLSTQRSFREPKEKKSHSLVETVILIFMTIIAIVFIWLFLQKYAEWEAVKTDVDGQVDAAVAMAVAENTTKLENEFAEREKEPQRDFMGPADYGSLSFKYPKTWSVYIAKDAASGGDFEAYLNPVEVNPVSATQINALRVTIRNTAFDSVVKTYDNLVKNGKVQFSTRNVGGVLANLYTGDLPNGIHGAITIFKLRDKTVMLQTDAELFIADYYALLDTVNMVQ